MTVENERRGDSKKSATPDANDYTTKYEYDLVHRVVKTIDAAGKFTSSLFDRDGLMVGTTDADGRLEVDFDPAWADGEYTLVFTAPQGAGGAEEEPVTFVAGDAVLGLTPVAGKAAPGGRISYAGTLTVAGKPLAGRDIDLAYTQGTEQAPGTAADATLLLGEMRKLDGRGTITTQDDGTFTVDPSKSPKQMVIKPTGGPAKGHTVKALYKIEGDTLTIALGDKDRRPSDFTGKRLKFRLRKPEKR